MITAEILADSINPSGNRITSWLLTYPRFIHSEFMTHRVFSRNAASSRAIPLQKMIEAILKEPALPEYWAAEHKGMQALEPIMNSRYIERDWISAMMEMITAARNLSDDSLAKSLCNRLLEPWAHITVIATATDHSNFFSLRAHPAAMPEFQVLAYRMLDRYIASKPTHLAWGEWHIPFSDVNDSILTIEEQLKVATARCCWVSYNNHDRTDFSLEKAYKRHDESTQAGHWSPFEHCAKAQTIDHPISYHWSNFDSDAPSNWQQYRKQFPQENRTDQNLEEIMDTKPEWITLTA